MFEPPSSAALAGLQAVVSAGLLFTFGHLLVDASTLGRLHFVSKIALAVPALTGWALVMMIAHIVSGGRVFSEPVAVRLATFFAFVALVGLRVYRLFKASKNPGRSRKYLWLLGAAFAAPLVIAGWQVFKNVPVSASATLDLHAGWTMQLLNGESTPSAIVSGDIPNYIPWMFHALTAFVADLVPGRNAWLAFGPLQILQVLGSVAALFALGRELTRRMTGGLAASFFAAACGGIGFVALRSIDFATHSGTGGSEGAMEYLGDLVTDRPYNATFLNLPGPLPRDIAFTLLLATLFSLVTGCMRKKLGWFATAGAIAGLVGLTGGESFLVVLVAGIAAIVVVGGVPRLSALGAFLGPAAALYSVWFIPFLFNFFDLGGVVPIAPDAPLDLSPVGILGGWSLVLPFAIWGIVLLVRRVRSDVGARLVLTLLVATALAVGVSFVPVVGDAFTSLESDEGLWPHLYLALALVAAFGFVDVRARLAEKNGGGAVLASAVVVAIGLVSPVVAAVGTALEEPKTEAFKLARASVAGEATTALTFLVEEGSGPCVAAVPFELSRPAFAHTGYRQVFWQGHPTGPNRARIRWKDVYERVAPQAARARDNESLVRGTTTRERWRTLVDKYGVDFVVVRPQDAGRGIFTGYSSRPVPLPAPGYRIFNVGRC